MRRRDFLAFAGAAAAAALPRTGRAQQAPAPLPLVGFLSGNSASSALTAEFAAGLAESGYVEGRSVAIQYRWADGQATRLPALLAELLAQRVNVIVMQGTAGYPNAASLYQAASAAGIPVVSGFGTNPQKLGFVDSLDRPGGNVTGMNNMTGELDGKRLSLLHDFVPSARMMGVLFNPSTAALGNMEDIQAAARQLGIRLDVRNASTAEAIDSAFASWRQVPIDALVVTASSFFAGQRQQIVPLASELRVPTIYEWREFVADGGLSSYGTRLSEFYRQLGQYAAQILKGKKPADLPIVQLSSFDFVINLKTAKALGITVPPSILTIATEVIE